jgi:hypothetical protein
MQTDESPSLRREVYLMAWRVMPSTVKEELSRARASFRADQHDRLEREALMSLPPYHHIVQRHAAF